MKVKRLHSARNYDGLIQKEMQIISHRNKLMEENFGSKKSIQPTLSKLLTDKDSQKCDENAFDQETAFKTKIVVTQSKEMFDFKFSESSNRSNSKLNQYINTHRKFKYEGQLSQN